MAVIFTLVPFVVSACVVRLMDLSWHIKPVWSIMYRPLKDLGFALSGYHLIDCSPSESVDEWHKFCDLVANDPELKTQVKPHYEALAHLLYRYVESKR